MLYPSVDKILNNVVDSKYELVHVISKRSKQMTKNDNYQKRTVTYKSSKNLGRALEEVADGLVVVKNK